MLGNSFKPRLLQTLMAESAPNFTGDVAKIRKGMEADEIRAQRLAESDARRGTPLDPSNPADRQSILDRRADQIEIGAEAARVAKERRPELFGGTNPLQSDNASPSMDEERRRRRMKMAGYGTAEAAEY